VIAAGLLYLAFFTCAAGMRRHGPTLLARWNRPLFAMHFRMIAAVLLVASLLAALSGRDGTRAFITWVGLLPLMAGSLLLCLSYRPACARIGFVLAFAVIVAGCLP